MSKESEVSATSEVQRDQNGDVKYVTVGAEHYFVNTDEDNYYGGTRAEITFNVADGVAEVQSIKDANRPEKGVESVHFRMVPVAKKAVLNIPGVNDVLSFEDSLMKRLEEGRNAV